MSNIQQARSIFLAKMENVIKAYEEADELFEEFDSLCDELPEKISNVDLRRSDLLHRYTNGEPMTDSQHIALSKALQELEEERRQLYDMEWLHATWNNNKNKINNKANRPFLRNAIKQRLAGLDNEYKPRVYSYAEIETIINTNTSEEKPKKKRGRKPGTKNLTDTQKKEILQWLAEGKTPESIAEEICISVSRIIRLSSDGISGII